MDALRLRRLLALLERTEEGAAAAAPDAIARAMGELEAELGVALYGLDPNGTPRPTALGRRLLPRLRRWLAEAQNLRQALSEGRADGEVRVFCSHYVATYLIVDRLAEFRRRRPEVRIRLSLRTEAQIAPTLLNDPSCAVGFCAPLEFPEALHYQHWFQMDWGLVVPVAHPLAARSQVGLGELVGEPMIVFEPGSTGRQHLYESFVRVGFEPTVAYQATTTALIVQMVEAGLGVAIVPLLPSGRVTAGRAVRALPLVERLEPIATGTFRRREWCDDPVLDELVGVITQAPT